MTVFYPQSGSKVWKADGEPETNNNTSTTTTWATVIDTAEECLLYGAVVTVPADTPAATGELRLTIDGVVEIFTFVGSTVGARFRDFIGDFGGQNTSQDVTNEDRTIASPKYCRNGFKLEVRNNTGSGSTSVTGISKHSVGNYEDI